MSHVSNLHPTQQVTEYINFLLRRAKVGYMVVSAEYVAGEKEIKLKAMTAAGANAKLVAKYAILPDHTLLVESISSSTNSSILLQDDSGVRLVPTKTLALEYVGTSSPFKPNLKTISAVWSEKNRVEANPLYGMRHKTINDVVSVRQLLALVPYPKAARISQRMRTKNYDVSADTIRNIDKNPHVAGAFSERDLEAITGLIRIFDARKEPIGAPNSGLDELPMSQLFPSGPVAAYVTRLLEISNTGYRAVHAKMVEHGPNWVCFVLQAERPDGAMTSFKAKGDVGPNLKLSITSLEGLEGPRRHLELPRRLHLMPSRAAVEGYYGSIEDGQERLERTTSAFAIPDAYTIMDLHGSPDRPSAGPQTASHTDDEDYFYGPTL